MAAIRAETTAAFGTGRAEISPAGRTAAGPAARSSVTVVDVAGLLANAYRDNLGLQDVGRALGDSKAIHSGAHAMAVLEELRSALLAAPGKRSAAEEWLGNFANWFADGSFGAQTADEFSRF